MSEFKRKLVLTEMGNYLAIYPIAAYEYIEYSVVGDTWQNGYKQHTDGRLWEHEKIFAKLIASNHDKLNTDTYQDFFLLDIKSALHKNWFVNFYRFCTNRAIDVVFKNLQKININPETPTFDYGFKTGIDSFDMHIKVAFNNVGVSINELRKAVINNDTLVKLQDGKYGLLTEEWLKIIAPVFLFGQISNKKVRLKRNHFAIIESLKKEVDVSSILKKRESLKEFDNIEQVELPKGLNAKLRDYQQAGFNWLVFLTNLKLGGCLADDMGLGKTVQILSLIAWYQEKFPKQKATHLVVCPTSLLFNWRNESDKFTPNLKVFTYWGGGRDKDIKYFKEYDIVLTSYGTLTNDLEFIHKYKFGLVVLDESQSIKTPSSQRAFAVKQLKSENRFVMTGTPIENNTLELWSQMDFINEGILGTAHQFKEHFGGVLDSVKDKDKAKSLKKLIHPFILRRVKSQVAKELPTKTEMILQCEMGSEQRMVYDTYRKEIRKKMATKIEENGLGRVKFSILPELLRLRQLCNGTSLIKGKEDLGDYSVKSDLLIEHILDKHQNHKILVFTQFLGMMDLISNRLDENSIKHIKLTGASRNREALVNEFESDNEIRVFLISLKAGGVGLNLVSADYVYIVDPWWNPAIENQAIDRAYRIGQTKKVFAYRMVCSNTIEDKIQIIQQRKQNLSDEIITTEDGFMKSLSEDDFTGLFE